MELNREVIPKYGTILKAIRNIGSHQTGYKFKICAGDRFVVLPDKSRTGKYLLKRECNDDAFIVFNHWGWAVHFFELTDEEEEIII